MKWVREEGIHLTLKFLGETPESRIGEIGEALEGAASGIGPVEVTLSGVGRFPDRGLPRVIWIGVKPRDDRLGVLQKQLETRLARRGFPEEKRAFRPHLTIGRVKSRRGGGELTAAIRDVEDRPVGDCRFEAVHLIESRLQSSGAVYRKVRTVLMEAH